MTVLEVQALGRSFAGVRAVHNVSFSLARGEMLALIGPNGAGKSTCFNMIGGQLRPTLGVALLGQKIITGLSPRRICRLGVGRTFQVAAVFASMTVLENVQMALLALTRGLWQPWRPARFQYEGAARAALAQVGLADQAQRGAAVLSYGDLKRLELAMALAHRPRLLLMDEPTAGMAGPERTALMQLVRRLVSVQGLAVLFTEHDMDVVFGVSDRIIVMNRGEIVAQGHPQHIRADARVRELYLGTGATSGGH